MNLDDIQTKLALLKDHIPQEPPPYCFTKQDYYLSCKEQGVSISQRYAIDIVNRKVESGEFLLWGKWKGRPYYYVKAAK